MALRVMLLGLAMTAAPLVSATAGDAPRDAANLNESVDSCGDGKIAGVSGPDRSACGQSGGPEIARTEETDDSGAIGPQFHEEAGGGIFHRRTIYVTMTGVPRPRLYPPLDYVGLCGGKTIGEFVIPGESGCAKAEYLAIGQANDGDAERYYVAAPLQDSNKLFYRSFGGVIAPQSQPQGP